MMGSPWSMSIKNSFVAARRMLITLNDFTCPSTLAIACCGFYIIPPKWAHTLAACLLAQQYYKARDLLYCGLFGYHILSGGSQQ